MEPKDQNRFEILRHLAVAGSRGEDIRPTVETALGQASRLVGLTASRMYLWDDNWTVGLTVSYSESDSSAERLASLEQDLFRSLRKDRQLVSAYLAFGGSEPYQTFTLPLSYGRTTFGAVIGILEGNRRLLDEDIFLEAISAAISLHIAAAGAGADSATFKDTVDKERLSAILETAVTVNHEINNPLTAILGNVQLLLLHRKDLDDDLANKLKTIESSAMRIKDITQRLLRLTSAKSVEYAEGTNMLDLSEDSNDKKK